MFNLTNEALNNVTSQRWSNAIRYTRNIEKTFCEVDFGEAYPTSVDNVIIGLNADDEADSDVCSSCCERSCCEQRGNVIVTDFHPAFTYFILDDDFTIWSQPFTLDFITFFVHLLFYDFCVYTQFLGVSSTYISALEGTYVAKIVPQMSHKIHRLTIIFLRF